MQLAMRVTFFPGEGWEGMYDLLGSCSSCCCKSRLPIISLIPAAASDFFLLKVEGNEASDPDTKEGDGLGAPSIRPELMGRGSERRNIKN